MNSYSRKDVVEEIIAYLKSLNVRPKAIPTILKAQKDRGVSNVLSAQTAYLALVLNGIRNETVKEALESQEILDGIVALQIRKSFGKYKPVLVPTT